MHKREQTVSASHKLPSPPPDYERAVLALSMIEEVGAAKTRYLLEAFDCPMDIFSGNRSALWAVPHIGRKEVENILRFNRWGEVDRQLEFTRSEEIHLITPYNHHYPPLLRQIHDPPVLLWVKGDPSILNRPFLAIVGTRKTSSYGVRATVGLTRQWVDHTSAGVVSGMAKGVDTLAHQTTLARGGITVAVLGSGIHRIYPRSNVKLSREIVQSGGALISEFLPEARPERHHFPIRNRVVSGMSIGVLVTETGIAGGSNITVHAALEQGREVFVVPHNLSNPLGTGCNRIIRDGYGKLVTGIADILDEWPEGFFERHFECFALQKPSVSPGSSGFSVSPSLSGSNTSRGQGLQRKLPADTGRKELAEPVDPAELDGAEQRVFRMLCEGDRHIDELAGMLQLPLSRLASILLGLEIKGMVRQKPGKKFSCGI